MADNIGIIQYQGKDIVYVDYSNVEDIEALKERVRRVEELERGTGRNDILELIDITGSYADTEMLEVLKQSARGSTDMIKKSAVIGVTGVKRILLALVNKFSGQSIEPKDTKEEALEWLVKD